MNMMKTNKYTQQSETANYNNKIKRSIPYAQGEGDKEVIENMRGEGECNCKTHVKARIGIGESCGRVVA